MGSHVAPPMRLPVVPTDNRETRVKVRRDLHGEVAKAVYSLLEEQLTSRDLGLQAPVRWFG